MVSVRAPFGIRLGVRMGKATWVRCVVNKTPAIAAFYKQLLPPLSKPKPSGQSGPLKFCYSHNYSAATEILDGVCSLHPLKKQSGIGRGGAGGVPSQKSCEQQ